MSQKSRPAADRFWEKVNKLEGEDSCWEWTASLFNSGYGRFKNDNKLVRSNRFAWEYYEGPIPPGLQVLHTCDNRKCVRRKHLFLGTHKINMKDRNLKGRQARGESCGKSKLTWDQVYIIRYSGLPLKELSKKFNIGKRNISQIKSKKTWWPEPKEIKCL